MRSTTSISAINNPLILIEQVHDIHLKENLIILEKEFKAFQQTVQQKSDSAYSRVLQYIDNSVQSVITYCSNQETIHTTRYLNDYFRRTLRLCQIIQIPEEHEPTLIECFDSIFKRHILLQHDTLLRNVAFENFSNAGNTLFHIISPIAIDQQTPFLDWVIEFTDAKNNKITTQSQLTAFKKKLYQATVLLCHFKKQYTMLNHIGTQNTIGQIVPTDQTPAHLITDNTQQDSRDNLDSNIYEYLRKIYSQANCFTIDNSDEIAVSEPETPEQFNNQFTILIKTITKQIVGTHTFLEPKPTNHVSSVPNNNIVHLEKKLGLFQKNILCRYQGQRQSSIEKFGYEEVKRILEITSYHLEYNNWMAKPQHMSTILTFIDECDKCAEGMLDRLLMIRNLYQDNPFETNLYQFRYQRSLELIREKSQLHLPREIIGSEIHIYHSLVSEILPTKGPDHYPKAWDLVMDENMAKRILLHTKRYTSINHCFFFMWQDYLEKLKTIHHPHPYQQDLYDDDITTLTSLTFNPDEKFELHKYLDIIDAENYFQNVKLQQSSSLYTDVSLILQLLPDLTESCINNSITLLGDNWLEPARNQSSIEWPDLCKVLFQTDRDKFIYLRNLKPGEGEREAVRGLRKVLSLTSSTLGLITWIRQETFEQFALVSSLLKALLQIRIHYPNHQKSVQPVVLQTMDIITEILSRYLTKVGFSDHTQPVNSKVDMHTNITTLSPEIEQQMQNFCNMLTTMITVPQDDISFIVAKKTLQRLYRDPSLKLGIKKNTYLNMRSLITYCQDIALDNNLPFYFVFSQFQPWRSEASNQVNLMKSLHAYSSIEQWKGVNQTRLEHFIYIQEKHSSMVCPLANPPIYRLFTELYTKTAITNLHLSHLADYCAQSNHYLTTNHNLHVLFPYIKQQNNEYYLIKKHLHYSGIFAQLTGRGKHILSACLRLIDSIKLSLPGTFQDIDYQYFLELSLSNYENPLSTDTLRSALATRFCINPALAEQTPEMQQLLLCNFWKLTLPDIIQRNTNNTYTHSTNLTKIWIIRGIQQNINKISIIQWLNRSESNANDTFIKSKASFWLKYLWETKSTLEDHEIIHELFIHLLEKPETKPYINHRNSTLQQCIPSFFKSMRITSLTELKQTQSLLQIIFELFNKHPYARTGYPTTWIANIQTHPEINFSHTQSLGHIYNSPLFSALLSCTGQSSLRDRNNQETWDKMILDYTYWIVYSLQSATGDELIHFKEKMIEIFFLHQAAFTLIDNLMSKLHHNRPAVMHHLEPELAEKIHEIQKRTIIMPPHQSIKRKIDCLMIYGYGLIHLLNNILYKHSLEPGDIKKCRLQFKKIDLDSLELILGINTKKRKQESEQPLSNKKAKIQLYNNLIPVPNTSPANFI